jgi:hypothetical protein
VAFQLWKGPYGMVLCYPKQKAPAWFTWYSECSIQNQVKRWITDCHDIPEILLKVALNTMKPKQNKPIHW